MTRLFAIGNCMGAVDRFRDLVAETMVSLSIEEAEEFIDNDTIIMYGGGEDISPSIYTKWHNPRTYAPSIPSQRDQIEIKIFEIGKRKGAAHFGICRGHQLLAALNGANLFQHVDNHNGMHDSVVQPTDPISFITHYVYREGFREGTTIPVSSVHHQAVDFKSLKQENPNAVELLSNSPLSSKYHIDLKTKTPQEVEKDNEGFFIPETKCLGIQGHPEFVPTNHIFNMYCRLLFKGLRAYVAH